MSAVRDVTMSDEKKGGSRAARFAVRLIFLLINVVFWGTSLAMTGYLALEIISNPSTTYFIIGSQTVAGVIILTGACTFIAGLIGFMTGMRLNGKCLRIYMGLVCVFLVLEIGVVGYIWSYKQNNADFRTMFTESEFQNGIQVELECCGYSGPQDYTAASTTTTDSAVTASTETTSEGADTTSADLHLSCYNVTITLGWAIYTPYLSGCSALLTEKGNQLAFYFLVTGFVILAMQVLAVALAVLLLHKLKEAPSDEERSQKIVHRERRKYNIISSTAEQQTKS